ncbi:MAG: MBL fold metallo-hydrolase [Actinobacteria bacterium]|nr:MBL fold metallo-hydrolase [Actinomycetota bacterium]
MSATVDEIAEGVYRISTHAPEGPPGGITFNQFLIDDDDPILIHTGMRMHFAATLGAASQVMAPDRLRWITSNHASRPDELGALDSWLAVAPRAEVVHGEVACRVNLADVSEGRLRAVADRGLVDVGDHHMRWLATPHVPGPWEAGFWFDETSATLFTGDLFAQAGPAPSLSTADVVSPAIAHDRHSRSTALTPSTAPTIRALGELRPATLALMHGPSFTGDCTAALAALADHFGRCLSKSAPECVQEF